MFRARPPTGVKLVGGTGQSGYLASMAFVLKEQGGGVCHVHLPLDPLPFVRTYPGDNTILFQLTLEWSKADGLSTGLLPTSSKWGSRDI